MGEKNNVFKVYMERADRLQSVLEYHLGRKLPTDWLMNYTVESGFYSVITRKGKKSYRQRDIFKKVSIDGMEEASQAQRYVENGNAYRRCGKRDCGLSGSYY